MQAIVRSNEIDNYPNTKNFFEYIKQIAINRQGYIYFKYPISSSSKNEIPDIVIADKEYGIVIINLYDWYYEDIKYITSDIWNINDEEMDNPFLILDDYATSLKSNFQSQRLLRNKINVNRVVIFPLITDENILFSKMQGINIEPYYEKIIFGKGLNLNYEDLWMKKSNLYNEEADLFIAIMQGAGPLNTLKRIEREKTYEKIGDAIKHINHKINVLAEEQHIAAIQIPDGPQRIRGMAGTGKTIILTMKAAYIHAYEPKAKILYTFHTQALYNQIMDLISKFYRSLKGTEPDWDIMLVRHSWGTKYKEGVYTRACSRNSIQQQPFSKSYDNPLDIVFTNLNSKQLEEEYDYVLIDEAQDFPPSFFQVIYKLTKSPKRIIFAYDELQSLNNIKTVDVEELFGKNKQGNYLVDFSKGSYGNGIEMDYILRKSYRNPLEILMLAHALGLGIHHPSGKMQVIEDKKVWEAIGYEIIKGNCLAGDHMVIKRPVENSISVVHDFYIGKINTIRFIKADSLKEEIDEVVNDIEKMIKIENVMPHHIVIIALSNLNLKQYFSTIKNELFSKGISSIAPGFDIDRDAFGIEGSVTLSTVHKAKGNEAFIVYAIGCEAIYDYADFLEARNKAFTALTRSKGWLIMSGVGSNMEKVINECRKIMDDISVDKKLDFIFPDKEHIVRKLSAEEHARRKAVKVKGEKVISDLLKLDSEYIESLPEETLEKLKKKMNWR